MTYFLSGCDKPGMSDWLDSILYYPRCDIFFLLCYFGPLLDDTFEQHVNVLPNQVDLANTTLKLTHTFEHIPQ